MPQISKIAVRKFIAAKLHFGYVQSRLLAHVVAVADSGSRPLFFSLAFAFCSTILLLKFINSLIFSLKFDA